MVKRPIYLEQIAKFIDADLVKVITGIRRSGKSTILFMLKDMLLKKKIKAENIIYINMEDLEHSEIQTAKLFNSYIKKITKKDERYYLLIDEVQEVEEWELAIKSLLASKKYDIYITGSNSKLLSSELATYLAGRSIEINIFTLSFTEFLDFRKTFTTDINIRKEVMEYLKLGGFPIVNIQRYDYDTAYKIVQDIYSSVILKDTVKRYSVRNIALLEKVIRYIFENIGNTFSAKNISDYFKSENRKIDIETVYNYINYLTASYILHPVRRYDIKGKEVLKTFEKYYLGDISFLYALIGFRMDKISQIMENIVYQHLVSQGYNVYIGKLGDKEIDFIAEKQNEKVYIQVAYIIANSQETIDREFSGLLSIADNYPKYVVTLDDLPISNISGIKHIHLADFLQSTNLHNVK